MKNCLMIVVALSTFLFSAASALAHATMDHASPPVGSSLATAPSEVVLFFTDVLEPAFSTIEVRNENGALMSSGKAEVDPDHGTQLRVALKPLSAGRYKVIWRAIPLDTHPPRATSYSTSGSRVWVCRLWPILLKNSRNANGIKIF
jgi:methionine-rich copper-binding protein CopC